ncbi:MFS transporter [Kribbella italica]|uniref:OPA family glycerol-3-phosphate transporter-like MFS transporter n=1 Tax=Kribbella italica TaxID=1540520 RepID=A0A7W9J4V6_9ACTN|nr:MFS transporter [Kribbella italica]MBB5835671.1 OPA family glycerol-3-phosphate transporter-like MFS transporter [Kribbella italica]
MSITGKSPDEVGVSLEPVSELRFRRLQWRMLLSAMFCYLFFYTGRQTFGFAIPGIEADLGLSKTTLGAISGGLLWCYAAGQMINGNLADKLGGRRIMALGAILSTILNWCTSFAIGSKSLALAWGANGFAQAMGWPSGGRVIANWWTPRERGTSLGFYTFAAGMASVLAYVTSTLVVDTFGLDWHWIFRVPVLLMLVGGITFYFVSRETPEQAGVTPPRSFTEQQDAVAPDGRELSAGERSIDRYRAVLSSGRIWSTGIAIGFQNAARYGLLIWVPVYFLGADWKSGDSAVNPIWISVALPVGMAVGALTNGQVSDRLFGSRRDRPIAIFMLLGALFAMVMFLVPLGTVTGIAVLFLTGFFVYGPQASFWALCPDIAGKRMAGTATGVVNFFSYLFAGAAEPLVGHIMDSTGQTSYIFPIVAGSCVASALVALTIRR